MLTAWPLVTLLVHNTLAQGLALRQLLVSAYARQTIGRLLSRVSKLSCRVCVVSLVVNASLHSPESRVLRLDGSGLGYSVERTVEACTL